MVISWTRQRWEVTVKNDDHAGVHTSYGIICQDRVWKVSNAISVNSLATLSMRMTRKWGSTKIMDRDVGTTN